MSECQAMNKSINRQHTNKETATTWKRNLILSLGNVSPSPPFSSIFLTFCLLFLFRLRSEGQQRDVLRSIKYRITLNTDSFFSYVRFFSLPSHSWDFRFRKWIHFWDGRILMCICRYFHLAEYIVKSMRIEQQRICFFFRDD